MSKHPVNEFSESTVEKIKEMVDANTVTGTPIVTPDGVMVIPVSKVSLGLVSGGTDFTKTAPNFGCATGTGITITPVAFLVIKEGNVRLINVSKPAGTTLDRVVDLVPEVMDKVSEWTGKDKQ